MLRMLVLVVAIASFGCQGHSQEGPGVTPQAAVLPAAPAAAARAEPVWWCINADYGGSRVCVPELAACQRMSSGLISTGRQVSGECASQVSAFCFRRDDMAEPRCAATIDACRLWRDITFAKGINDTAMGECVEQRQGGRALARPSPSSPIASLPRWWCTVTGGGLDRCDRVASFCESDLKNLGEGVAKGECTPRDRAECFARQFRNGLATLECAPDHLGCGRLRDAAISGASNGSVTSDCAERR